MERGAGQKTPLFEALAEEIVHQVEIGTFRPGERIPSVRQMSRQRHLSITTVLQAYHSLEDRHVIEARPQSGYYALPWAAVMPVAGAHALQTGPSAVNMDQLATLVMRDMVNPELVQFGAAVPDPSLLPTTRLDYLLAEVARGHCTDCARRNTCGTPEGCDALRAQVAQRTFLAGCSLAPQDIMVTSGCTEALSLALAAVCQPGDLVAVELPTYFGHLQILQSLGLKALEIPTSPRTGLSLDVLRFALDHHPVRACLVVPNYQNPLGSCMPLETKSDLVRMLAERDIPLIEDDIYGELYSQGPRPKVAKSFDRKGLVILCSSFSKDLSPGYRVGWAAPGRFQERMELLKLARNISTPILLQLAIARFIERGGYDRHLRRIRRAYAARIQAMSQAIRLTFPPGTAVTSPGGGFILWVRLPNGVDLVALYRLAIQAGITIAPGCLFSTDPSLYRNCVRLNAAYMTDGTRTALQTLSELVRQLAYGQQEPADHQP